MRGGGGPAESGSRPRRRFPFRGQNTYQKLFLLAQCRISRDGPPYTTTTHGKFEWPREVPARSGQLSASPNKERPTKQKRLHSTAYDMLKPAGCRPCGPSNARSGENERACNDSAKRSASRLQSAWPMERSVQMRNCRLRLPGKICRSRAPLRRVLCSVLRALQVTRAGWSRRTASSVGPGCTAALSCGHFAGRPELVYAAL